MKKLLEHLTDSVKKPETPDYSSPQALKAMVTEHYSGIAKSLRRANHKNAVFYALLDFDKPRLKRRISATIGSIGQLRERVSDICPDIPGVFCLEEDWAAANSTPITSLEIQEERMSLSTGAAIWILDRIREAGRMDEALRLLPSDSETLDELYMPDLWDPCHSRSVILGMLAVIQSRNRDCAPPEGPRHKRADDASERIFTDRFTLEDSHRQDVPSRERFEAVLALIPEADVQDAVRRFEEKFWDWTTRYYRCRAQFAAREQKLAKSYDRFWTRAELAAKEHQAAVERTRSAPAVLRSGPAELPGMLPAMPFSRDRTSGSGNMLQMVRSLNEEMARLDSQVDSLSDEISDFMFDTVSNAAAILPELLDKYDSDIARALFGFKVGDPFELCFALLYLLDRGSDLPWLYFPTVNLMENAGCALPWGMGAYKESHDDIWNPPEDGENRMLRRGPRRGRAAQMPDWYNPEYIDKVSDLPGQKRTSLAQIVYELTGGVMPRNMHRYDAALGELACYGITGHSALPVLHSMALMGEARRQTLSEEPETDLEADERAAEEQQLPPDTPADDTVRRLQEMVASLKQENGKLKRAAHSALREAEDGRQRYGALEEQIREERRELAELREVLFYQQNDIEPPTDTAVEYPYTVRKRTVVFGGHDSWARAIKPLLKGDIRFIDRNMLPNADLIRHADIIWLQTNSLSHKYYNKIMDVVRTYGIPLHYFKFASAEKCAEQIVLQD